MRITSFRKKTAAITVSAAMLVAGMASGVPQASAYDLADSMVAGAITNPYWTNTEGQTVSQTMTGKENISQWNSNMRIAQGAANDNPSAYQQGTLNNENVPSDLYSLYGTWDSEKLYLMWEMTNVNDVVGGERQQDPILFRGHNVPFYLAIDTNRQSDRIGQTTTVGENSGVAAPGSDGKVVFGRNTNRIIRFESNQHTGITIYGGDANGINETPMYSGDPEQTDVQTTGAAFYWANGLLSSSEPIIGLSGHNAANAGSRSAFDVAGVENWENLNDTNKHNTFDTDFHCVLEIPLTELNITAEDIAKTGLGVQLVSTYKQENSADIPSAVDSLPYDFSALQDNVEVTDASAAYNSAETVDIDFFNTDYARIGAPDGGSIDDTVPVESVVISSDAIEETESTDGSLVKSINLHTVKTPAIHLSATVLPDNATDKSVAWSSDNPAVAQVDAQGIVTVIGAGSATITASAGGASDSVFVNVIDEIAPETVTITGDDLVQGVLTLNATSHVQSQLQAVVGPEGADQTVIWSVDDDEIAAVGDDGLVTALQAGETKVYATSAENDAVKASVTVKVMQDVPVSTLKITGEDVVDGNVALDVRMKKNSQLNAVIDPHANDEIIGWSSSDPTVVTVDENGLLTTKKVGTATITANAGSLTDSVKVTVSKAHNKDSVALRRDGVHFLPKLVASEGQPDYQYTYGRVSTHSDKAVFMGDWDGDGIDTPAIRTDYSTFLVTNNPTGGNADMQFQYGTPKDNDEDFVVGDWDGDGKDTIAVRRGSELHVHNSLTVGWAEIRYDYITATGEIFAGDWDGDGIDTPAVRVLGTRRVNENNKVVFTNVPDGREGNLPSDVWYYYYAQEGDQLLVGDWDGDGCDEIGYRRGNQLTLQGNVHDADSVYTTFAFGNADDQLYTGFWGTTVPQSVN